MPALPIIAPIIAGASLLVAGVGTYATIKNQNKMVKEQKKAARFERQKQQLSETRTKIEAVRQTREALANAQQAAENQGVADSSGAQGGQGSIVSQFEGNLSFLDQYGFLSDQAGQALQRAMTFQGRSSMWSGISDFAMKVYGATGGLSGGGSSGGGSVGPRPPSANGLMTGTLGNGFSSSIFSNLGR